MGRLGYLLLIVKAFSCGSPRQGGFGGLLVDQPFWVTTFSEISTSLMFGGGGTSYIRSTITLATIACRRALERFARNAPRVNAATLTKPR
jgi:hypothetical protein